MREFKRYIQYIPPAIAGALSFTALVCSFSSSPPMVSEKIPARIRPGSIAPLLPCDSRGLPVPNKDGTNRLTAILDAGQQQMQVSASDARRLPDGTIVISGPNGENLVFGGMRQMGNQVVVDRQIGLVYPPGTDLSALTVAELLSRTNLSLPKGYGQSESGSPVHARHVMGVFGGDAGIPGMVGEIDLMGGRLCFTARAGILEVDKNTGKFALSNLVSKQNLFLQAQSEKAEKAARLQTRQAEAPTPTKTVQPTQEATKVVPKTPTATTVSGISTTTPGATQNQEKAPSTPVASRFADGARKNIEGWLDNLPKVGEEGWKWLIKVLSNDPKSAISEIFAIVGGSYLLYRVGKIVRGLF